MYFMSFRNDVGISVLKINYLSTCTILYYIVSLCLHVLSMDLKDLK